MLNILFFTLFFHYYHSLYTQSEYFNKFEAKVKYEEDKPFKEAFKTFEFLIEHYAFYHDDVYFIAAPYYEVDHPVNKRIIHELRSFGWNVSIQKKVITSSEYVHSGVLGGHVYRINSLNDKEDNHLNYRAVISVIQDFTVHAMYVKADYYTDGLCAYLEGWPSCTKPPRYVTVFKLDTRYRPNLYKRDERDEVRILMSFIMIISFALYMFIFFMTALK